MSRSPYASLFVRLSEIHMWDRETETCFKCQERIPCETMRALWVFDLEEHGPHEASD